MHWTVTGWMCAWKTKTGANAPSAWTLAQLGPDFSEDRTLQAIGIKPWRLELPPVVGEVTPGSGAEAGGMRSGDLIISIAGQPVRGWY